MKLIPLANLSRKTEMERGERQVSLRSCFLMSTVYFNLLTSERSGCIGAMTIMKTYFVLKRKFVKTT